MNLIFLGPPGAGKGTQAARMCRILGIPQVSTGDILRQAIKDKTRTGLEAKAFIDAGQLVPDAVVIQIVRERLAMTDCAEGFVLDGFPRTVPQAEALQDVAAIDTVINIEISDEALVSRLSGRRVCVACGETYHINRLRTGEACAVCGGQLTQREDDKPETVLNRLRVYHAQTSPLIAYYSQKGLLKTIDGDKDIDEAFGLIRAALGI
ncbi:MAG: adenylate kinase [Clostridia bacterium]|nr:adenylate kinase [Clostridia bacterium]